MAAAGATQAIHSRLHYVTQQLFPDLSSFAPLPTMQISPAEVRSNSVPRIELAKSLLEVAVRAQRWKRELASTASGFNRRHVGTNSFQLGPSWDQCTLSLWEVSCCWLRLLPPCLLLGRTSPSREAASAGSVSRPSGLKLLYPYTLPYANDPLCLFTG